MLNASTTKVQTYVHTCPLINQLIKDLPRIASISQYLHLRIRILKSYPSVFGIPRSEIAR